jgi:hypothetical protein
MLSDQEENKRDCELDYIILKVVSTVPNFFLLDKKMFIQFFLQSVFLFLIKPIQTYKFYGIYYDVTISIN